AQRYRLGRHSLNSEPSATGLCEPDLHVFAKLFEDCLKGGLEAQAFSGREVCGDDDVLGFLPLSMSIWMDPCRMVGENKLATRRKRTLRLTSQRFHHTLTSVRTN